jgi:hypothetical protein
MSTNVLSRISKGQLRGFEEALEAAKTDIEESWKSEEHRGAVGRDLQCIIGQALQIPKMLRDVRNSTFDRLFDHKVDDYDQTRKELREAFDPGLRIIARVLELVGAFERLGGTLSGASELRLANDQVRWLEKEIFEEWPWFAELDTAKTLDDVRRGEFIDITDAFAQAAGVDRESWLRHVEEHKRRKRA